MPYTYFMTHVALAFILLLITSCATMLNGTQEKIHVRSDVPGTSLYLDDRFLGVDQASVLVRKKDLKKVRLLAKKDGCTSQDAKLKTQFDSTTLFGLFIDLGIFSILLIDWAIYGSVREAERTGYVLSPSCSSPATLPTHPSSAPGTSPLVPLSN